MDYTFFKTVNKMSAWESRRRRRRRKRTTLSVNCKSAVNYSCDDRSRLFLLARQQLANNSKSANVQNNINRSSKMPDSPTTTMPTCDGKSEKFAMFKDHFQTSLKVNIQQTAEVKINCFHSFMSGDALQTFKINND